MPLKLAILLGSHREGRLCGTIGRWVQAQLATRDDFDPDLIDPDVLALPSRHQSEPDEAIRTLRQRIDRADAYLVVTPEYNHAYPAVLKFMIDSAYAEWHRKPVAFVSYGGQAGGLRAVEQLRLVFAELQAVTVRDGVAFADAWDRFDDAGRLREPESAVRAMQHMLGHLGWWARALRAARLGAPGSPPSP